MATLINTSQNKTLLTKLTIADNFWLRGKGLLGKKGLTQDEGLWISRGILPSNNIHTFFMKFSIDCIFLNDEMIVKKIISSIKPGKLVPPVLGATSVIEVAAGLAEELKIQIGDQFHVGD